MSEPRTEAGRAVAHLLAEHYKQGTFGRHNADRSKMLADQDVAAIEAEAAQGAAPRATCSFGPCEHGSYCERHDHHSVADAFGQPFGHRAAPRAEGLEPEAAAATPPLDVPNASVLAAVLEDTPPHIITSALLDSGEGLATWIVSHWPEYARLAQQDGTGE